MSAPIHRLICVPEHLWHDFVAVVEGCGIKMRDFHGDGRDWKVLGVDLSASQNHTGDTDPHDADGATEAHSGPGVGK